MMSEQPTEEHKFSIIAYDRATGVQRWRDTPRTEVPHEGHQPDNGYASASAVTDGEVVLAYFGSRGLHAYDFSGKSLWHKDLGRQRTRNGFGEGSSPALHGNIVVVVWDHEGDDFIVAFDKKTGKEVWKNLSAKDQGYCPPTVIHAGGKDQLLIYHPEGLHSLDPLTGAEYWQVKMKPSYGMSITAPVRYKDHLFAGGIGNEAVMLKLDADRPAATELWRGGKPTRAVYPANATPLMPDGTLYGADSMSGEFRAVNVDTGEVLWKTHEPTNGKDAAAPHGTAFAVKNGDRYFLFSETGELILAKLSPGGYEEVGRAKLLDPTGEGMGRKVVWSHPAFADKKVFARNDKQIVCYDLAK